jgi:hypothetical protein
LAIVESVSFGTCGGHQEKSGVRGMGVGATVRWQRARALLGGAAATFEIVADLMDKPVRSVIARAEREGWADDAPQITVDRMMRLRGRLVRDMEALEADERPFDKARWDRVATMARWLEKLIADQKSENERQEKDPGQTGRTDEDIADMLRIIDARIEELARHYAAELVAGGAGGQAA